MCKKKFQRNPATQTKESLLLQSKLGQTALVLLLKNWLTLGRAEVKRFCRYLAIVPWLGACISTLQSELHTAISNIEQEFEADSKHK